MGLKSITIQHLTDLNQIDKFSASSTSWYSVCPPVHSTKFKDLSAVVSANQHLIKAFSRKLTHFLDLTKTIILSQSRNTL